jgi:hypothetical protein
MKKQFNLRKLVGVVSLAILVMSSNVLNAQSTDIGINFQALARDNNSNPAKERVVYLPKFFQLRRKNRTKLLTK